ncbi:choice-of-anchor Q domain-containing protein [Pedobacter sp. ASV28]|uniref:choice-of-anchor Q domain-containing protein n=1 Tax=Pedobacter sp. ASV28 TaxID=2795123 RepID=UPI0018EA8BE1|nr:choice-of-anchor Q domain-containing protein [Pedobacter sp. ASV28]
MKKYTLLFLCFVVIQSYAQTTRYVKADATGANNGTSWANAYTNFQIAVNAASSGDEVWVAAGTYQPASGQAFAMKEGVKIYGGFAGNEGTLGARNWTSNVTILQGNGSYVIKNELNGLTNAAVLDGFTVTGGSAVVAGAGMYNASSSPSVVNCTFSGNTATYGAGAIYNYQCSTPPMITNCIFSNNNGTTYGGAIYNVLSSPIIRGCTFNNNTAVTGGGIYYSNQSVPNISNCTFKNNAGSTAAGGAVYYNGSGVTSNAYISNCLFTGNTSNAGSAIGYGDQAANNLIITNCTFYNNTGSAAVYARFWNAGLRPIIFNNSIAYGNTSFFDRTASGGEIQVNYSLIQGASCPVGGTCNAGVIYNQDPKFVDVAAGNFKLKESSLAVNKGDNSLYAGLNSTTLDLAGGLRLLGATIDMGAFESPYNPVPVPDAGGIVYVKQNDAGNLSGNSWTNAAPELADVLKAAKTNSAIQQIWVAGGTYKPLYSPADNNFGSADGRNNAFLLVSNVKIYGGFAGTETTLSQRDLTIVANKSILSGDFNGDDVITGSGATLNIAGNSENAYHVVISVNNVNGAELNGFTINGGNANAATNIVVGTRTLNANLGGGLRNHTSSPILTNLSFVNNSAINDGGAMYNTSSLPNISNTNFSANLAANAGAMYNLASPLSISNTIFSGNSAQAGGAIVNISSSSTIDKVTFLGNFASLNGGALFNNNSSPVISNSSFTGNSATTNGGAVYSLSLSPKINRSTFTSNTAGAYGGAMFNNGASTIMHNSLLVNNTAQINGGGIWHQDANNALLQNCTLYGNTANGSNAVGLYISNGSVNVYNSLLWDNPVLQYATAGSGSVSLNYSLIKGNTNTVNHNIDASGLVASQIFNDISNQDFTLKFGGPAINTGSNSLYTGLNGSLLDLAGNARVYRFTNGGIIDIGAYEYQSPQVTPDANNIIYVNRNGQGGVGNGDSWINSMAQLSDALKWARQQNNFTDANPLKIYVAKGIYQPLYHAADASFAIDGGRDNAFVLVKNVQLYGGFAGTENSLNERDLKLVANKTILSGDLNGDDETTSTITANADNTNHVVLGVGNVGSAILDGFTIVGGHANTASTIVVNGQTIYQDRGAGIYNQGASPKITSCIISGHTATADDTGAGIYNYFASPLITNTLITGNKTLGTASGAAMYSTYSAPKILNVTVANNNGAGTANAAIYHNLSSPTIGNTVVYGNSSGILENTTVQAPAYQNPTVAINDNSTGTDPWNNPGNALTGNNSYATMSNAAQLIGGTVRNSHFLTVKGLGFNIPPNAEILGVEVEIRKLSSDNTSSNYTRDLDFRLLKNNQVAGTNQANIGVNWPTSETAFTYGSNGSLWGLILTPSDVNASDFGVAIAITSRAAGLLLPTVVSYIEQVRIKVSYRVDAITSVSYSIIQGGFAGTGNLDIDPKFANPTAFAAAPVNTGNYILHDESPAIGVGNNLLYTNNGGNLTTDKDLLGNKRLSGTSIDMGAYEYQELLATVLSNFANINKTFGDADFVLTAPTTNSDGAFTYTSSDENVATINGSTVTIVGVGTTTITAAQAATGNYAAGSISLTLTVDKADQTISFAALANKTYGDADFNLNATGGASGNAVTYTSSNPLVATIAGNTVTIVGAGSTAIIASQLGNANYNAAINVQQTLTVDKADQTISFAVLANKTYGDADFDLSAMGGASGNVVTYTSSNPLVATILGNTVTIVGVGSTTITASQLGDANYNAAANVQQTLTVGKADQTISFAALNPKTTNTADFALTATAGSGLSVSYSSSNTTVAETYQDGGVWKIRIRGAGTTDITAQQAGNAYYHAAANVVQTLLVVDPVLPVVLTSYTVKILNQTARLDWILSSEKENRKFVIYRSGSDGIFKAIGEVLGLGNTSADRSYSYVDRQPLNGNNYYRLVQVGNDGKEMDLGTRVLAFSLSAQNLRLYPNPTQGKVNIAFSSGQYHSMSLSGVDGKVFLKVLLRPDQTELVLDLSAYPVGVYFVRLSGRENSDSRKVVKQ